MSDDSNGRALAHALKDLPVEESLRCLPPTEQIVRRGRQRSVRRRTALTATAGAALALTGVAIATITGSATRSRQTVEVADGRVPSSKPASPTAQTTDPQGDAQRRAAALVSQVTVPPGSKEVQQPPSPQLAQAALNIGTSRKEDAHRIWTTTQSLADVQRFFASHDQAGTRSTGSGSSGSATSGISYVYVYGDLQIQAAELLGGHVGIRVDAVVLWLPTREPAEQVPAGVSAVEIITYRSTADHVLARTVVTGPQAQHLRDLVNALTRADDTRLNNCMADDGTRQRLTFTTPAGTATVTGFFCGSVTFSLNGKHYPELSPSQPLTAEVTRLLKQ